jgi:hypothetical protein
VPLPQENSAEGGTPTDTVSTANSGGASGDAFSDLTIGAGGALIYDNAQAIDTVAIKYTQAGTPSFTRFGWATGSITEIYGRVYIYRTAFPTGTGAQFAWLDLSGTGSCAWFDINTTGNVRVWDADNGSATMTAAIELDAWNRIEYHIVCNATTGSVEAKLFSGHSATEVETATRTGVNTRAGATHMFHGEGWVQDANGVCWFDDMLINGTGYPGPSQVAAASQLPQAARVRYF